MSRAFGTHSWADLPLSPQECGGSLGPVSRKANQ